MQNETFLKNHIFFLMNLKPILTVGNAYICQEKIKNLRYLLFTIFYYIPDDPNPL